jgi:hypothetical protein
VHHSISIELIEVIGIWVPACAAEWRLTDTSRPPEYLWRRVVALSVRILQGKTGTQNPEKRSAIYHCLQ